ncbi:MAG: TauD/TfdA family dioxygenase [Pseudomonadota bacterium]
MAGATCSKGSFLNINARDHPPIHSLFAAEVTSLDLDLVPTAETLSVVKAALAQYTVLVFRDQDVSDDQQVAFSECFGSLESTKVGTPGAGSKLIVLSNIGPDGAIEPPTGRQVLNNKANQHWHANSSFKPVPAKASMLSARIIPLSGGNTEYISMRAVYAALSEEDKAGVMFAPEAPTPARPQRSSQIT